jgi:hypothetical protein
MHKDPKSANKDCQLDCIFALLRSVSIKAVRITLMKSTPLHIQRCVRHSLTMEDRDKLTSACVYIYENSTEFDVTG